MSKEGKVPLPVPRFHVDPLVGQFGKAERAFEALVCSLEDFRVLLQKAYNVLAHYGVKYFTDKWDQVADGDRCIDDIVAVFTGSTACMTTNFLEELDRAREAWTAGRRIFVVCVGLMPVTDKKTKKLQELTNGTAKTSRWHQRVALNKRWMDKGVIALDLCPIDLGHGNPPPLPPLPVPPGPVRIRPPLPPRPGALIFPSEPSYLPAEELRQFRLLPEAPSSTPKVDPIVKGNFFKRMSEKLKTARLTGTPKEYKGCELKDMKQPASQACASFTRLLVMALSLRFGPRIACVTYGKVAGEGLTNSKFDHPNKWDKSSLHNTSTHMKRLECWTGVSLCCNVSHPAFFRNAKDEDSVLLPWVQVIVDSVDYSLKHGRCNCKIKESEDAV